VDIISGVRVSASDILFNIRSPLFVKLFLSWGVLDLLTQLLSDLFSDDITKGDRQQKLQKLFVVRDKGRRPLGSIL